MTELNEFTQPIDIVIPINEIGDRGIIRTLSLNDDQRAVLSKELDLSDFVAFSCEWELKALHKNRFRLMATIKAELTQPSAISLEPVECHIEESFKTEFWPLKQNDPVKSPELEIDYIDEIIEFYDNESFDIGQIIYENFVIALEQYPANEGEVFEWDGQTSEKDEKTNPFAALKVLKSKD